MGRLRIRVGRGRLSTGRAIVGGSNTAWWRWTSTFGRAPAVVERHRERARRRMADQQVPGGAAAWAASVGSVPVAALTATKLSWLHRTEPEHGRSSPRGVAPPWMTMRFTGELVTDRGDASGTAYWSPFTGEYRWDLLAIIDGERDWSAVVPRVAGPTDIVGEWGSVKVACGTGDNMAAALGLGLKPGVAVLSLGTSGTAYAVSDHPTADESGAVAGFADASGRYLPLACTLNATKVTDAISGLLGVRHEEFDRLALSAAPGAGGLTLLPYFDGERTPDLPRRRFGGRRPQRHLA